jgi:PAS domain S-box-containing protein
MAMPFSPAFERYPVGKLLLRAQRHPLTAYGSAILLVGSASLIGWAIGDSIFGVPFITFPPAIVLATLIGGLRPGVLAVALSALAAWSFFLPAGDLAERWGMTMAFIFVSIINLGVVALLHAAVRHVLSHEENLRILIEASPTGIVVVDDDGKIKLINSSTEKLFGYSRGELLGRSVEDLVPADRAAQHRVVRAAFFKKPEVRAMGAGLKLSGRSKDATEFPVEVALNPVRRNGRKGVLATVIDITDQRKAREAEQLVIGELRHRKKNLFSVFQAIANQSLDEGKTPAEMRAVIIGRIQALSDAYRMVANSGWQGAPLSQIIDRQLAGFPKRISVSGCNIVVAPSAAQQFALVTHELATNAVKYGALSVEGGHVSIEGRVERLNGSGIFSFAWKEAGGPVVSKPTRKGFGTVILQSAVHSLARSVAMDFDPQGLHYEVQFDLDVIAVPTGHIAPSSAEADQKVLVG